MIGLLAVAVGLRFTFIEAHDFALNESQKLLAIKASQNVLRNEIGNNDYNVTVQDHGSIISTANGDKKVVRVVLNQGNITLTALVDMDTGSVVEKTRTESSGWITDFQNQNPKRWGHQQLFNR